MKVMNFFRFLLCAILVFFLGIYVLVLPELNERSTNSLLMTAGGKGTMDDPFLIETAEQFASFRDSTNKGDHYEGYYFLQTDDIDLESYSPWIPIGETGTSFYFLGYYDGGGHTIANLICNGYDDRMASANVGLFGQLGGTVTNLGIVSGHIVGDYVGSIASHSTGSSALIFNCYSLVDISGAYRGGGIVDNFVGGYIGNSWYDGKNDSAWSAGIASLNTMGMFNCSSVIPPTTEAHSGFILESLQRPVEYLNSPDFAHDLNMTIESSEAFFKREPGTSTAWTFSQGQVSFEG